MIQTRWGHLNRSYSLLTRVQAMFLDGHLLLEQTARSRSGRFFNFNGTAGLWRRSCIDEAGGWQHDTLTEDLDLSYRAQLAGWNFIFLPDVDHAGGAAGGHERLQVAAASLDQRLDPDLQETASHDLAQQPAADDQDRGDRASHLEFRLPAAGLFLRAAPSLRAAGRRAGWVRTLLLDVPIFLTASVSVAVFYICAQRELHPRTWMKEILLLPALLALGVGLSLNNARAVLEAVFNHKSDFARTPKYGIERKSQPWRCCKYMPLKSLLPIAEMAFAIYFTYFVWFAIQHRSVPFSPVSGHVPGRFPLRLALLARAMVAEIQLWRRARGGDNSRVTNVGICSKDTCVMFRLSLAPGRALFRFAASLPRRWSQPRSSSACAIRS